MTDVAVNKEEEPMRLAPRTSPFLFRVLATTLLFALGGVDARAALVDCQADRSGDGLVLYLYFPTSSDSDFPSPMFGERMPPRARLSEPTNATLNAPMDAGLPKNTSVQP